MAELLKPKRTPFPPTEKQLEKAVKQTYLTAWEETRALIAEMYERYAVGDVLTRTDMVRYNRMAKVEDGLAEILRGLYKQNKKFMYQQIEAAALAGYFEQIYELEMMSETLLGFGGLNRRAIEEIQNMSLTGLTLNERLKKNERDIVARIRQELAQGLIQGETYQKTAKRFKGVLEGDMAKAVRVAWTETHRAEEESAFQVREKAKEMLEFDEIWVSTLDGRTRRSHRNMDGKKKGADGYFNVNGYKGRYPGDPRLPAKEVVHCRCTSIVRFPDRPVGERRGRKSLDEYTRQNNELFPADMNYEKWYNSRILNGDRPRKA